MYFSSIFPCYSSGKHIVCVFGRITLAESPWRGNSNKYIKRMIHKKMFKSICYSCFRRVHIKFLYNSKFDLTVKFLVTNSVVITRVVCFRFNPFRLDAHFYADSADPVQMLQKTASDQGLQFAYRNSYAKYNKSKIPIKNP